MVIAGIKDGEISWKGNMAKLLLGVGKDKVVSKFGRKPKTMSNRFSDTWSGLMGQTKKKKED